MSDAPALSQIDTIVVLMLENRSLDSLLGWLYADENPPAVYPLDSGASFNGAVGQSQTFNGAPLSPPSNTQQPGWFSTRVPAYDPNEDFADMVAQMFCNGEGQWINADGQSINPIAPFSTVPSMQGYAFNYSASYVKEVSEVMGGFTAEELPVLYGLASAFAVSDAWFASAPCQTNANRAFSICGTSLGCVNNDEFTTQFGTTPTLFNALAQTDRSFGIYWQNRYLGSGSGGLKTWPTCYTVDMFPQIYAVAGAPGSGKPGVIDTYANFLSAVESGEPIPAFCYIETFWGGGKGNEGGDDSGTAWTGVQGNDYHPCSDVGPAEAALNELYKRLRAHPQWDNMLIVITFDEAGGTWDHVPPPSTVAPDSQLGEAARAFNFTFESLGPRVPTLLISPYVSPGTVFRAESGALDHTSLIATILKWADVNPAEANLGSRVAQAPTFEGVLSSTPVNTSSPTCFQVPDNYASNAKGLGALWIAGVYSGNISDDGAEAVFETVISHTGPLPGMFR
ncbi:MAG: phospholipase C [Myxococcota bacterium]|jgi:phospholipase C